MSAVAYNSLANAAGRITVAAINIFVTPFYIKTLGLDAYGVAAFAATLATLLSLLDLGLAGTVSREIAKRRAKFADAIVSLPWIFEIIYWAMACLIAIITSVSSQSIAGGWLKESSLGRDELAQAVSLIGLMIAARWPIAYYASLLRGSERQVRDNCLQVFGASSRALTTIALLIYWGPSIYSFLVGQVLATLLEVVAYRITSLGSRFKRTKFEWKEVRVLFHSALELNLVGALGVWVAATDRVLVSLTQNTESIGAYNLAITLASIPLIFSNACAMALFPRFAFLAETGAQNESNRMLVLLTTLVSFFTIGPSIAIAIWSKEILLLWTQSAALAAMASEPLSLLAFAWMLNAIYNIPYTRIIALGRYKAPLIANGLMALLAPMLAWQLSINYGMRGAAAACVACNVIYSACYFYVIIAKQDVVCFVALAWYLVISCCISALCFYYVYAFWFKSGALGFISSLIVCSVIYCCINGSGVYMLYKSDLKSLNRSALSRSLFDHKWL